MSRSGYSDSLDEWSLIRWRGAVKSALRGKRGQAFLKDMLAGLDAMTEKRLVKSALVTAEGEVCALGAGCVVRKIDVSNVDPEEPEQVAEALDLSDAMVREVAYENDEGHWNETPEQRWTRMRAWVASKIIA